MRDGEEPMESLDDVTRPSQASELKPKETEIEKDHEISRRARVLHRTRRIAGTTVAAVLAGFASTAVVYGSDGDVAVMPWWP